MLEHLVWIECDQDGTSVSVDNSVLVSAQHIVQQAGLVQMQQIRHVVDAV